MFHHCSGRLTRFVAAETVVPEPLPPSGRHVVCVRFVARPVRVVSVVTIDGGGDGREVRIECSTARLLVTIERLVVGPGSLPLLEQVAQLAQRRAELLGERVHQAGDRARSTEIQVEPVR